MNQELLRIVENIARDKNIDKESIFVDLEEAMVSAVRKHFGDTESEITRDYTIYPALPALLGGLVGHWTFWEVRLAPSPWGMFSCIGLLILLIVWSALAKNEIGPYAIYSAHMFCSRHPCIVVATAYILGGILWGLAPSEKQLA